MASILGFSAYLPERVVANEELAAQLGVEASWILEACGIQERRYAAPDQSVLDLAEGAARACLERTGIGKGQLGAILVGTGTPDRSFPGVSADLQAKLGASDAFALDIHLASAGGLVAMALAVELCPKLGPVLVVGAERMSEVVQRHPAKETTILFGDGAGACVVVPGDGPYPVLDWKLGSDGSFAEDLSLVPGQALQMNGRQVIMQANRKLSGVVKELLERHGIPGSSVELFLFHQANLNLLRQVARNLGADPAKVFVNLDLRGNTSAASLLIAAAEAEAQGRLGPGMLAVLAAFGSGFTWGGMLLGPS